MKNNLLKLIWGKLAGEHAQHLIIISVTIKERTLLKKIKICYIYIYISHIWVTKTPTKLYQNLEVI